MRAYTELVRRVLDDGERRDDRTGTGTLMLFGVHLEFDLRDGYPLVTTKRVPFRNVAREYLWFLSGSTNTRDLHCGIWDDWADPDGECPRIYGAQWRGWECPDGRVVDQIRWVVDELRARPTSRRAVVSAWNPADLPVQALPPCHTMWQLSASGEWLDLHLYQRSMDLGLGGPFNVAGYALVLSLLARELGLSPRRLVVSIGDAHVYLDHVAGLREQVSREPRQLPALVLPPCGLWETVARREELLADGSLRVDGYDPHPRIPLAVSV